MKKIFYVTTNIYKYQIALNVLKKISLDKTVKLEHLNLSCPEIQDERVEEIALYSARWASQRVGKPVITSDSGFSIKALNNFPGPFIKYINQWLLPEDILNLLDNKKNHEAFFIDALAYVHPSGVEKVFCSKTSGKIINNTKKIDHNKNSLGWNMDSIFIPHGFNKVLSELSEEDRLKVWNISRWLKLKNFLNNYGKNN